MIDPDWKTLALRGLVYLWIGAGFGLILGVMFQRYLAALVHSLGLALYNLAIRAKNAPSWTRDYSRLKAIELLSLPGSQFDQGTLRKAHETVHAWPWRSFERAAVGRSLGRWVVHTIHQVKDQKTGLELVKAIANALQPAPPVAPEDEVGADG
jgi:hypothetical protein